MVESVPPGGNWKYIPLTIPSKRLDQIRRSGGRTTLYGRLDWHKPSYTITTYFNRPGNGAYIHPRDNRVISAREAARLQSFRDGYVFEGPRSSLCVQIGNAVPPLLAYAIADNMRRVDPSISTFVDLFSGAGGLSEGFKWAGLKGLAANDILPHASATYRANHPETSFIEGDITQAHIKQELLDSIADDVDLVAGGPPCQGFSYAGKRMIDDPRNFLYKEFVDLVSKIQPRYILIENVEGIITSNSGKTFQSIKESFEDLGYSIAGRKIHAVQYGVPQKRKRVIIIGSRIGPADNLFPEPILSEDKFVTVKDAIYNLPPLEANGGVDLLKSLPRPQSHYQEFAAGHLRPALFLKELGTYSQRQPRVA
jgi:DNA (cytosine-5)-methyltransferase 1